MPEVITKQELNAPAEKVWELIGNFNALANWHPVVESSELSDGGSIRTLKIAGGGEIIERLEKLNEDEYEYNYSIVAGPLPVSDYSSVLKVVKNDDRTCTVEWGGKFKPLGATSEQAEEVVRGIYEAGFANLKKIFGSA